ncbi:hypothetical protein [Nitrosomonas communis]|uniref:hypothetical protein n=1 Tax=Nitrosomonas communis TaxID=44574 RepID=UPI0015A567C0|nr:hypothetical protein [Nitrosomonas communis]
MIPVLSSEIGYRDLFTKNYLLESILVGDAKVSIYLILLNQALPNHRWETSLALHFRGYPKHPDYTAMSQHYRQFGIGLRKIDFLILILDTAICSGFSIGMTALISSGSSKSSKIYLLKFTLYTPQFQVMKTKTTFLEL